MFGGWQIYARPDNAPFRRPSAIVVQWVERQDAARAVLGHGWPVAACPRSNDEARGPAAGGPDVWGKTFWLLLGRLPKVTRRKGGTSHSGNIGAAFEHKSKSKSKSIAGKPAQKPVGNASQFPTLPIVLIQRDMGLCRLRHFPAGKKNRPKAVFSITLSPYSCGPAFLMASDTSNFLKLSMNCCASTLAAAS